VAGSDRCQDTPYIIYHKNGIDTVRVDQTGYGSFWNIIGNFTFSGTPSDIIKITDGGTTDGYICADAVRIVPYDNVTGIHSSIIHSTDGYGLMQNHPNPFSQETEINYQLPKASDVNLSVFDLQGRQIKTLVHQKQDAGHYAVTWNGTDGGGDRVASGVYFIQMEAKGYRAVIEMLYTK